MIDLNLTPAHLHLALNHIPIIGLAVSCFPILIGALLQCRTTMAVGLIATLLCAAAMPTIMETGGNAADALTNGSMQPQLDEAGKIAMHIHGSRADKTAPIIYASALIALMALIALTKFSKAATWLSATVLLGNAISIAFAIWTADAGGRIRHQEFRPATPWDKPTASISAPSPTAAGSPSTTPMATPAAVSMTNNVLPTSMPSASPTSAVVR